VKEEIQFTPFSYMAYSIRFEELSLTRKLFTEKSKNELSFRGFLYGMRLSLADLNKFPITQEKLFPEERYFEELTENKICLSLNGAAEICNRDLEILSAGSVLFRPKLNQKFYNDLIPNFHYIPFDLSENPIEQMEIIERKYDEIKDNNQLLSEIAENGYKWYHENGTTNANVDILKQILNINLLK
jgi:hypothetical protein